jgi:hypothetical protein
VVAQLTSLKAAHLGTCLLCASDGQSDIIIIIMLPIKQSDMSAAAKKLRAVANR